MNQRRKISKGYPRKHSVPAGTKVIVDPITYNEIFIKIMENQIKIMNVLIDGTSLTNETKELWCEQVKSLNADTMNVIRRIRGPS